MALSGLATQAGWQEFSFSGTDLSVGDAQRVVVNGGYKGVSSDDSLGDQYLVVSVAHSDSAATATVVLAIVDVDDDLSALVGVGEASGTGGGIIRIDTMACTATTVRSNWDGSGGKYLCTGSFTSGGGVTFDLTGIGLKGRVPRVYVFCTALSAGSITVYVCPGRAV